VTSGAGSSDRRRNVFRAIIAVFYLAAGAIHCLYPAVFVTVMPAFVPYPFGVVIATGVCEILGAIALYIPRLRWLAGVMLAAYAVCVYPANIQHAWNDIAIAHDYAKLWYHVPRLPLQPVAIWWALYAGGVIDWPWRRKQIAAT
jgi:uncharacterized membrane protein